ncbi:hypothetical protein BC332_28614 [Capsicum chinense]|nr:hypothetical protein BC332_28614 [Capsicum chinense]
MDGLHGCNSPVINSGKSVTQEGSKGNGVWLLRLFARREERRENERVKRVSPGFPSNGGWPTVVALAISRKRKRKRDREKKEKVCLSSVDPVSFPAAVEAGALMSMMCVTSYCADNAFYIINLMRETKRLLPSVTLSVTVLHIQSLPDQVKLDEQLELEGVDIIQMEGEKCSTPSKTGVLGLIKKVTKHLWVYYWLEASSKCSSFITLSSKSEINPNVINWKGVSKDVKDDYFGEFKNGENKLGGYFMNGAKKLGMYMALKIGRDPTPSELHLHVHTHNHDGKSLVGERSRLLHEFVKQLIPALTTHFLSIVIEHVGGIRVQQGVVLDPPPNNDDDNNVDS